MRPAQQVSAQLGEQEAVRGDPADRLQHVERAGDKVRRGDRRCQGRQRQAQCGSLFAEPANPELPALIRHRGLRGCPSGSREGEALEQARYQKQRDHGDAEAQPRQSKFRQQGNRAWAEAAQVAAHADHAVESRVNERAAIETVASEWLFGLALRAVVRPIAVRIGDLFQVLLNRTWEWVYNAVCIVMQCVQPNSRLSRFLAERCADL
jgi:hypothetical protein